MVRIDYALDEKDERVYILQSSSGQPGLRCPICEQALIVKMGASVVSHFAHKATNKDCLGTSTPLEFLLGYQLFAVMLTAKQKEELDYIRLYPGRSSNRAMANKLQINGWITRGGRLTDQGKIVYNELSLPDFARLYPILIGKQYQKLVANVAKLERHISPTFQEENKKLQKLRSDLDDFRSIWRRRLKETLYFLEIQHADKVFYKIGVTQDVPQRRAQITGDLARRGLNNAVVTVLRTYPHYGTVELYFKYRYTLFNWPIGPLTEYFQFSDVGSVLADLDGIPEKVFSNLEREVLESAARAENDIKEARPVSKMSDTLARFFMPDPADSDSISEPSLFDEIDE